MADKQINELTAATTINDSDLFVLQQSNTAKKITGATFKSLMKGANGTNGSNGTAATVTVGTVTTGAAGTQASVTNSGTSNAAVLNFTIPRGENGIDVPKNATVAGWALKGDGSCYGNSNAYLVKYNVTAGEKLYLKIAKAHEGVYQFQTAANVPASTPNPNIVGSAVTTAVDGLITVPATASYLIVSQAAADSPNIVTKGIYAYELIDSAKEILNVTYGTTTAAEISAALAAGKLPVCRYNNEKNYIYSYESSDKYYFISCGSSSHYVMSVSKSASTYTRSTSSLALTSNYYTKTEIDTKIGDVESALAALR